MQPCCTPRPTALARLVPAGALASAAERGAGADVATPPGGPAGE